MVGYLEGLSLNISAYCYKVDLIRRCLCQQRLQKMSIYYKSIIQKNAPVKLTAPSEIETEMNKNLSSKKVPGYDLVAGQTLKEQELWNFCIYQCSNSLTLHDRRCIKALYVGKS